MGKKKIGRYFTSSHYYSKAGCEVLNCLLFPCECTGVEVSCSEGGISYRKGRKEDEEGVDCR
jgi:hypothetical protein